MNISNIKYCDISNGIGVRTSIFVSGCRRHCKGCFNESAWPFDAGYELTWPVVEEIIDSLKPDYIAGLSILGGEPLEPENQVTVYELCKIVREKLPNKTIWLYTGNTLESMRKLRYPILRLIDVLVDGEFREEQKSIALKFRGSWNQRIIDMRKTLNEHKVVLWEEQIPCLNPFHPS